MEVPDKRVKNIAINKKVAIIVRQMINASVSVQYLCTKPDGIPNIGPDGIPNIVLKGSFLNSRH